MSSTVSLSALFARALESASNASKLSMMDEAMEGLVISSLRDLKKLAQAIDVTGMFSSNETLDDIATRHLPYLLVEYVMAEMENRMGTSDRTERMQRIQHSQRHIHFFLERLSQHEVIPEEARNLYPQKSPGYTNLARRRELKIKQFKQEKLLRSQLDTIRAHRGQVITSSNDDLDLIASLLPAPNTSDEEQQADDDNELRRISLVVICLMWAQARNQVESMERELELLLSVPAVEPLHTRDSGGDTWRLDPPIFHGGPDGKGPLMDSSGRPLRPFTILPGGAPSQRSRMQAEIFRPDYRLPTMTMDEYLEEERRRGNIITGGGPQSQCAPTQSEQLTLDSEMDGTINGELKAEEKRQEDESWARYTDLHPKGEGNTMNRG